MHRALSSATDEIELGNATGSQCRLNAELNFSQWSLQRDGAMPLTYRGPHRKGKHLSICLAIYEQQRAAHCTLCVTGFSYRVKKGTSRNNSCLASNDKTIPAGPEAKLHQHSTLKVQHKRLIAYLIMNTIHHQSPQEVVHCLEPSLGVS